MFTTDSHYDLIVVGSGIAGLSTALLAEPHARVLLLTKGGLSDSNTWHAQGGIAAAVGADDDPRRHAEDTLVAGAGLAEARPVRALTEAGKRVVDHLLRYGVRFDRGPGGALALGREGAHGLNRILHAGGDATGARIVEALEAALLRSPVAIRERHLVTSLTRSPGGAIDGVTALDAEGRPVTYRASAVVLATGGAGQLFRRTTNPPVATADGLALAARAGAALTDLEFYQFHPTALALAGAPPFLISEAVRGEGAILRNAAGRAFMPDYHPLADLAPRDVVARAIVAEMRAADHPCAYLDLRHRPAGWVRERFPTIAATCAGHGLDLARDLIPVAPAAHYSMGGIRTDLWGATDAPGLYAAGEAADDAEGPWQPDLSIEVALPPSQSSSGERDATDWEAARSTVQTTMWDRVGLLRDGDGLATARRDLAALLADLPSPRDHAEHETANLTAVGRLMAEAAHRRTESRGAHYRADYPASSPAWRRHINVVLRTEG